MNEIKKCISCPRGCAVDRESGERGFCGVGTEYVVSSADLHRWEEPCISGKRGSGAIFFSGCNLRCVFCQNKDISRDVCGKIYSEDELCRVMLSLCERGAHNINLVTPTPYAHMLAKALEKIKPRLHVPVVYNCGGYESVEALRSLDGLVDVYLPDFKYYSDELALSLSGVRDYRERASHAVLEMYRQVGRLKTDKEGMAERGLIVRHLVLPSHREDSKNVLRHLSEILPSENVTLSLMRQYTPDFADEDAPRALHRRLTSFEYEDVLDYAIKLGFDGFSQEKESASRAFTPKFDTENTEKQN